MAAIDITDVDKSFGKTEVLRGISLSLDEGEFVAVLGPSGCGKTTLLRTIAGFETINRGSIRVGGKLLSGKGRHLAPEERGIGVVFQNYALWPHMTVAGNVSYGLKVNGVSGKERRARTAEVLEMVGLTALAERQPAELSGGQRQRVALARCLAMRSAVVLLDEPLANLDVHLRAGMEDEFARFHKESGATMLYITHDQSEALALADRIAVLDKGRVSQFAAPQQLYNEPANEMVATFIGEGQICKIRDFRPDGTGTGRASLSGHEVRLRCRPDEAPRNKAKIAFHPEDLRLTEGSGIPAIVRRVTYRGSLQRVEIAMEGCTHPLFLNVPASVRLQAGQCIAVALEDGWVLPAS